LLYIKITCMQATFSGKGSLPAAALGIIGGVSCPGGKRPCQEK
jgi:hypothetical protein